MNNGSKHTWHQIILPLVLLDALMITVAFFLAYWLRISSGLLLFESDASLSNYMRLFALSVPILLLIFYTVCLYDPNDLFYGTIEYINVAKALSYGVIAVVVIGFFFRPAPSRGWLIIFWLLAIFMVNLNRFAFRRMVRKRLKSGLGPDRALIVGADEEAKAIGERLFETGRMELVGFLDDFNPIGQEVIPGIPIKGVPRDYKQITAQEGITHIIFVSGAVGWETAQEMFSAATNGNGLQILISPGFGELSASLHVSYTGYIPLLRFRPGYKTGLDKFLKFGIDLALATSRLVLSLPIQILVILWMLWRKGRPIFVAEELLGRFEEPFKAFSFRIGPRESILRYLLSEKQEDERKSKNKVLSFENALFSCGFHRLPRLLNVILNQMSLVGPRPLTRESAHHYGIWLPKLLSVKPGMTGLWAVQKISNLQYEATQTISYIHSWTPWKDLHFLFLTVIYIVQHFLPSLVLNRKISKNMTDPKAAWKPNLFLRRHQTRH